MGHGGACPDYSVGDARIVNRLRVSCFCLAVTITETGFVTIAVTEFLKKYTSAGGNWLNSVKMSLVNYYKGTYTLDFNVALGALATSCDIESNLVYILHYKRPAKLRLKPTSGEGNNQVA